AHDPTLDREVAIKLMWRGQHDDPQGRNRLLREAQAMAQLSHPNVVEVYDVGTHGADLYIAMEKIRGQDLQAWLHGQQRPWTEIVAMFVQAGRGLAAAHAAALVHRDFKPNNVLVDEQGTARVLDFGLALPTERRGADPSTSTRDGEPSRPSADSGPTELIGKSTPNRLSITLTEPGVVMGTPSYMAPEQHMGDEVGPATDQFAFCVALYEGLYGVHPFQIGDMHQLVLDKLQGQLPTPNGGAVPKAVFSVIARGLAPAPADRWPSMDALLEQLEAAAMPRRARWPWILTAVAAAAVVLTTVFRPEPDGVCPQLRAQLDTVWNEHSRQTVRDALGKTESSFAADTVARVDERLGEYASRWTDIHTTVCESERAQPSLFERQQACLRHRLERLEATVQVLGSGEPELVVEAASLTQRLPALEQCATETPDDDQMPLPDDPEVAARVRELQGQGMRIAVWVEAGLYDEAYEQTTRAYAEAQALGYSPLVERLGAMLGYVMVERGQHEEAEALLVDVLHHAEASGNDTTAVLTASYLVGLVGHRMSRPEDGLRWGRHGEALLARIDDDRRPEAELLAATGAVLIDARQFEQAMAKLHEAVALLTELEGPDHSRTAKARNSLGVALYRMGRYEEAAREHERTVAILSDNYGPRHPSVGVALAGQTNAEVKLGNLDKALEMRRRVYEIFRASLGPEHPKVAVALQGLGHSMSRLGRYEEAVDYYQQSLAIREKISDPDDPRLATVWLNFGAKLKDVQRYDEALAYLRRARASLEHSKGDHLWTARALMSTGSVLKVRGEQVEAVQMYEEALAMLRRIYDPSYVEVTRTQAALGEVLVEFQDYDRGREHLEQSLRGMLEGGGSPTDLAFTRFALALSLRGLGQEPTRARALVEQAREFWRAHASTSKEELADADAFLANDGDGRKPEPSVTSVRPNNL
ncbi:MAG: serine/threonine-protein kinase, partial [Deltaproteobacteria bacterium]|nr:serine/threonine-protein kinase [Deltaproteobacteria bacterium]